MATFQKAKSEGFTKAIIRGYREACGSGGGVDPNFVQTYKNARSAGITNIDTYMFMCSGSGNSCKSYATQVSEIASTFNANSMSYLVASSTMNFQADSLTQRWPLARSG